MVKRRKKPRWAENGARVRARRLELGLTPTQAAESVGLKQNYWSQIERGSTALSGYDRRAQVAAALRMDLPAFVVLWGSAPTKKRRRKAKRPVERLDVKNIHVAQDGGSGGVPQPASAFSAPEAGAA